MVILSLDIDMLATPFSTDMECVTACCWLPCQQHPLLRYLATMSPLSRTPVTSTPGVCCLGSSRYIPVYELSEVMNECSNHCSRLIASDLPYYCILYSL